MKEQRAQQEGECHPTLPSVGSLPSLIGSLLWRKQNVSNRNLTLRIALWHWGLKAGLETERSGEVLFSSASELYFFLNCLSQKFIIRVDGTV